MVANNTAVKVLVDSLWYILNIRKRFYRELFLLTISVSVENPVSFQDSADRHTMNHWQHTLK